MKSSTYYESDKDDSDMIMTLPMPKRNRTVNLEPNEQPQLLTEDQFEEMANPSTETVVFTDEHQKALDLVEHRQNILITGPAGTGKT